MESRAISGLCQPTDVICPHPNCGLAFSNLRTLKKHFELHNTSSQCVKCTKCVETFADLVSYEKHARNHCGKEGVTPLFNASRVRPEPPSSKRQREPENYERLAEELNIPAHVDTSDDFLDQHIAAVAMRNNNQIYMCQQRENDLILGLEECSLTLDRALHMIMLMSGGNLDNIPIDMQHTSLKYSVNRRQTYRPPDYYTSSRGSDSGESHSVQSSALSTSEVGDISHAQYTKQSAKATESSGSSYR